MTAFRAAVALHPLPRPPRLVQEGTDGGSPGTTATDSGDPSVVDLWRDLRAVTRDIRPDWDLSTPGVREDWDAGDLSAFHGWSTRAGREPTAI
jgi:hypothetical protein